MGTLFRPKGVCACGLGRLAGRLRICGSGRFLGSLSDSVSILKTVLRQRTVPGQPPVPRCPPAPHPLRPPPARLPPSPGLPRPATPGRHLPPPPPQPPPLLPPLPPQVEASHFGTRVWFSKVDAAVRACGRIDSQGLAECVNLSVCLQRQDTCSLGGVSIGFSLGSGTLCMFEPWVKLFLL